MSLQQQASTLVADTQAWLSGNSLNIALALGAGVGIALVLIGIRSLGCRLLAKSKTGDLHWRTIFARVLAKTGFLFIVMASAELVAEHAATPPSLLRVIHIVFVISAALQAAIWGRELILGIVEHKAQGTEEDRGSLGSAIGLIRILVSVALFALAIILILDNLGVNVTGLIAGLGIGGIAIGLAAQGIFSDLFAALAIIFDKPFRKGDQITFGTTTGVVENIGIKSTRVRALTGEEVIISNAKLLEQQVQNWALIDRRRAVMAFGLVYHTTPELLARVPLEVKEIVDSQPLGSFDRCHAFQFAASSIDFELVFHVESPAYPDVMAVKQAVILGMIRRFAELKIEFAYPTQTSFTAAPDGTLIMPYPPEEAEQSNPSSSRT
ncbi:MAG TPA: mechanosensitive ion channel family protein [Allosphingosinicella sp.]|nr:mechanosensitive ion channel family protein [Allosphingosinicella sp.]